MRKRPLITWQGAYAILVCCFLIAPIVAAIILSFSSVSMLQMPPPGFSLQWYQAALSERKFISGFVNSFQIALASSLIAGVAGTLAAVALNNYRFNGRETLRILLLLPLIVPSIVIGLGLLQSYTLVGVGGVGFWQVTMGHAVIGVPYVVYMVLAAMTHYDIRLEHAAQSLGASRMQTFFGITFPMIRTGVLAGIAFAFLVSFDEVALSLFLTRGNTLPLRLVQHIQYYADPSVAAVSTLTTVASIMLLLIAGVVLKRRSGHYPPRATR
ncbi:ABC transporter permease [Mesorhizobium sp. VNQ89]|uniref:ABC transporter permease n=1 Tax=Mesorhizobium quangtriensis TaxID=3157709 RepID=UPI0032B87EB2